MPGMVLGGRYQVQDKIGSGGMATVYRGQDEVLGRTVAIKTMLPQYATDPSFAARFKQEAQAAAALQSPYIVSVYDWGKDADTYYIVMEYLRGTDLKSGIKKHGALDCKKVAQIGSQIAQALSVAHRHDIIHRDIKPQNIMVQPDGNIKVMDFGIARAKNSHLTQDNSVLGTAHYVSPEQTQGKELGPTTDIYSLGIVMYEAATGQVPFQGDDAISVALKQVNEQPKPPSQLNPAVDPSLESIILKCMQKNPDDRFQSAQELYHVLRDYLAGRMTQVNNATAMIAAQVTNKLEPGQGMAAAASSTSTMPRAAGRTGQYRPLRATDEAAEQAEEASRKRTRKIVLGVVGGLLALGIVIFALVNVLGSGSKTYEVPNLSGMDQATAVSTIEKDGHFTVKEVKQSYSSTVEAGKVMDQDPRAGRQMEEGTEITIWISQGAEPKEQVTVPDLKNMTAKEAQEACTKVGLTAVAGDEVEDDSVTEGNIASQDVTAGTTVDKGTKVTYHVSKGAAQETIPTGIEGNSKASAVSALEAKGFVVNVEYEENSSKEGMVISVNPSEGTSVAKGSTVTITVGVAPSEVDVPNVIGMTYSDASSKLRSNGFYAAYSSSSAIDPDGIVTAQSATKALSGDTITLTVVSSDDGSGNSGQSTGGGTANADGSDGTGRKDQSTGGGSANADGSKEDDGTGNSGNSTGGGSANAGNN